MSKILVLTGGAKIWADQMGVARIKYLENGTLETQVECISVMQWAEGDNQITFKVPVDQILAVCNWALGCPDWHQKPKTQEPYIHWPG